MSQHPAEVLARALYLAGPMLPGGHVPTERWERLAAAQQRQWLEAGAWLLSQLERAGLHVTTL